MLDLQTTPRDKEFGDDEFNLVAEQNEISFSQMDLEQNEEQDEFKMKLNSFSDPASGGLEFGETDDFGQFD